ncbi:hypothetical protein [Nocardia pseudovaccinii]|uniref:hypothetical protein n=1 Tax=Nocardia pseudovaccinii TaxID=189540 RepID=UPI0012F5123E|nr:hypothetical protein [Nocardia pseudovaccinii]
MPRVEDYWALKALACLRGTSIAVQAHGFILEGLKNAFDPAEIERQMEAEKQRLLRAAAELRAEEPTVEHPAEAVSVE